MLVEVVSEKTGYPAEVLEPGMQLDADLGIDSIKRVEILAALQERLPEAPVIGPEHLGTIRTLGQIVEFLAGARARWAIRLPSPGSPAVRQGRTHAASSEERRIDRPGPDPDPPLRAESGRASPFNPVRRLIPKGRPDRREAVTAPGSRCRGLGARRRVRPDGLGPR